MPAHKKADHEKHIRRAITLPPSMDELLSTLKTKASKSASGVIADALLVLAHGMGVQVPVEAKTTQGASSGELTVFERVDINEGASSGDSGGGG